MKRKGFTNKATSEDGDVEIFCRYIRKNGKIIRPKRAKFFHFWVKSKKSA